MTRANMLPWCLLAVVIGSWSAGAFGWWIGGFDSRGDYCAALEALFTGLAFALLAWTLILQHQELQLQRQELKQAVAAHRDSATALGEQVRVTKEQPRVALTLERIRRLDDFVTDGGLVTAREAARLLGKYAPDAVFLEQTPDVALSSLIGLFAELGLLRRNGLLDDSLFRLATTPWRTEWNQLLFIAVHSHCLDPYAEHQRNNVLAFLADDLGSPSATGAPIGSQ